MLLINICFADIAGCNLSRFFHFYVKKLNEIKQEIRKSTYFVFHSHKIQKVISTFFIPCFVGAVRLCGNSCTPSIITARRDVASGDTVPVAIHKWWVYRASSALQHYYHCWTCLRHSIIPNIPKSAWIWHWPSHRNEISQVGTAAIEGGRSCYWRSLYCSHWRSWYCSYRMSCHHSAPQLLQRHFLPLTMACWLSVVSSCAVSLDFRISVLFGCVAIAAPPQL